MKTIIFSAIAILTLATPAHAQSIVLCAKEPTNVRASIVIPRHQDPSITLREYPPESRTIIDVIPANECRISRTNTYWVNGREWVVVEDIDYKGWVARDLLYRHP
jgi:hypothetical protein